VENCRSGFIKMITFLMFMINGMAMVSLFLIAMTVETIEAIPSMLVVFVIVMAINYLVMYANKL
jgi:hypothetical protein